MSKAARDIAEHRGVNLDEAAVVLSQTMAKDLASPFPSRRRRNRLAWLTGGLALAALALGSVHLVVSGVAGSQEIAYVCGVCIGGALSISTLLVRGWLK